MYFPEHHEAFLRLRAELRDRPVAVLGHVRPDGDCIGSQVAMTRALQALGFEALAVNRHPVPRNLASFVGDTPFLTVEEFTAQGHCAVAVDCAAPERIGLKLQACFPTLAGNLDHHVSNGGYAQVDIVVAEAAATAELLAGLFLDLDWPLDAVSAQALYVGIVADTGQFRYAPASARIFQICAELVQHGANPAAAALELFQSEPWSKIELTRRYLGGLKLEFDGRVCLGTLQKEDFDTCQASPDDSEGLVDLARDIAGVEVGVYLESRGEPLNKCSLRAMQQGWRMDKLAQRFGGGGHAKAAGFSFSEPLEAFYPVFMEALEAHLREIDTDAP